MSIELQVLFATVGAVIAAIQVLSYVGWKPSGSRQENAVQPTSCHRDHVHIEEIVANQTKIIERIVDQIEVTTQLQRQMMTEMKLHHKELLNSIQAQGVQVAEMRSEIKNPR